MRTQTCSAAGGAAAPPTDLALRMPSWVATPSVPVALNGAPGAYALTRPPGHHATRSAYGGSCYLNNAAIAAQALCENDFANVAIIDIDAHHGNGTQAIFYERPDVFTTSVHVDPGTGWFPHHVGFADETGRGGGLGRLRAFAPCLGAGGG